MCIRDSFRPGGTSCPGAVAFLQYAGRCAMVDFRDNRSVQGGLILWISNCFAKYVPGCTACLLYTSSPNRPRRAAGPPPRARPASPLTSSSFPLCALRRPFVHFVYCRTATHRFTPMPCTKMHSPALFPHPHSSATFPTGHPIYYLSLIHIEMCIRDSPYFLRKALVKAAGRLYPTL